MATGVMSPFGVLLGRALERAGACSPKESQDQGCVLECCCVIWSFCERMAASCRDPRTRTEGIAASWQGRELWACWVVLKTQPVQGLGSCWGPPAAAGSEVTPVLLGLSWICWCCKEIQFWN